MPRTEIPNPPTENSNNSSDNMKKFTVEIVNKVEFSTMCGPPSSQQIQTNVTVKTVSNASVKSEVDVTSSTTTQQSTSTKTNTSADIKTEPDAADIFGNLIDDNSFQDILKDMDFGKDINFGDFNGLDNLESVLDRSDEFKIDAGDNTKKDGPSVAPPTTPASNVTVSQSQFMNVASNNLQMSQNQTAQISTKFTTNTISSEMSQNQQFQQKLQRTFPQQSQAYPGGMGQPYSQIPSSTPQYQPVSVQSSMNNVPFMSTGNQMMPNQMVTSVQNQQFNISQSQQQYMNMSQFNPSSQQQRIPVTTTTMTNTSSADRTKLSPATTPVSQPTTPTSRMSFMGFPGVNQNSNQNTTVSSANMTLGGKEQAAQMLKQMAQQHQQQEYMPMRNLHEMPFNNSEFRSTSSPRSTQPTTTLPPSYSSQVSSSVNTTTTAANVSTSSVESTLQKSTPQQSLDMQKLPEQKQASSPAIMPGNASVNPSVRMPFHPTHSETPDGMFMNNSAVAMQMNQSQRMQMQTNQQQYHMQVSLALLLIKHFSSYPRSFSKTKVTFQSIAALREVILENSDHLSFLVI